MKETILMMLWQHQKALRLGAYLAMAYSCWMLLVFCIQGPGESPAPQAPLIPVREVKETASGLKVGYFAKPEACEREVKTGDTISIHYTGTLASGVKFDSSYDRTRGPSQFQLGVGEVIKGWEEGVLGMCVGEKRKLIVPPALGYGEEGDGGKKVLPGVTLFFHLELMDIKKDPAPANVM